MQSPVGSPRFAEVTKLASVGRMPDGAAFSSTRRSTHDSKIFRLLQAKAADETKARGQASRTASPGEAAMPVTRGEPRARNAEPVGRLHAMADHARMRRARKVSLARRKQARHKFGERVADSHSLEIGEAGDAMLAKVPTVTVGAADHRGKGSRLLFDKRDKTLGRRIELAVQIMMVLEEPPSRTIDSADFQSDGGTSSKRPPRELIGCWIVHPIGIEPVDDIVMTRDGDEPLSRGPNGSRNGCGANTGDSAIDD
jgi:hypothetical protein